MTKLEPKDNIFAIDAKLINHYMEKWDALIEKELRKKINLESFINTIDFTKSKIDKMYYVGNENFLEIFSWIIFKISFIISYNNFVIHFIKEFFKIFFVTA